MHKFNSINAHLLDNPERLRHEDPKLILKTAGIRDGMTVLEVGCGTGFYTFAAAKLVGGKGRIYAADISEDMLEILNERIKKRKIKNILPLLSKEASVPLNDGTADMIIIVNMFHEAYDKDAFIKELKRLMKRNARLLIIDHRKEPTPSGPPVSERVSYEDASALLGSRFDIVVRGPAGEYQYGLIAMKEDNSE